MFGCVVDPSFYKIPNLNKFKKTDSEPSRRQ